MPRWARIREFLYLNEVKMGDVPYTNVPWDSGYKQGYAIQIIHKGMNGLNLWMVCPFRN